MTITRMNMALYNILKKLPDITEEEAVRASSMDTLGAIETDVIEIKAKLESHDNYFRIMVGLQIAIILLLLNLSLR